MEQRIRRLAYGLAVAVLLSSVAQADQLPPRKVISGVTPATAAAIDYNFSLLWNWANGGKVASDNAPSLWSKTADGTGTGHLKCLGCGFLVSSATSSVGAAGKIKIEHTSPELVLSSGAVGNRARITLEGALLSGTWTIDKDTSDDFLVKGPESASNTAKFYNQIEFYSYGQVWKTDTIPVITTINVATGLQDPIAAAGNSQAAIWAIPNDAIRIGSFKMRVHFVCDDTANPASPAIAYQALEQSEAWALAGTLTFANINCTAGQYKATEWLSLVAPLADSKAIGVVVGNVAGAAADLRPPISIEIQYKIDAIGDPVDNP